MWDDEVDNQEERKQAPVPVEADQQEGQKQACPVPVEASQQEGQKPILYVGDVDELNVSLVDQTGFNMRHPGRQYAGRNVLVDDSEESFFNPQGKGRRILTDRLGLLAVASKDTHLQAANTPPLSVGEFKKIGVANTFHYAELLHAASFFRLGKDMYEQQCERDPKLFPRDYAVAHAVCKYAQYLMDRLDELVVRAVREQHCPKEKALVKDGILVHQEFLPSVDKLEEDLSLIHI